MPVMKSVRNLTQLQSIGIQKESPLPEPPKDDGIDKLVKVIAESTAAHERAILVNAQAILQVASRLQPAKETVVVEAQRTTRWKFTCQYDQYGKIISVIAEAKG